MKKKLSTYDESERALASLKEQVCSRCPNKLMALVTNEHERPCRQYAVRRHDLPTGRYRYRIKCQTQISSPIALANGSKRTDKNIKWSFVTDKPILNKYSKERIDR